MKASEFVSEDKKFHKDHLRAMPGMEKFDSIDNSNPYHMWRFLVAVAGQPNDGTHPDLELDGPLGQKLNTISYSKEDAKIIAATAKSLGLAATQVSDHASDEPEDTHRTSPVKGFAGYQRR